MKIAIDMDGVIREGPLVPLELRNVEFMQHVPLVDGAKEALDILLREGHKIYILTAASYPDAKKLIRRQLGRLRADVHIITNVPIQLKVQAAEILRCELLFDDSPRAMATGGEPECVFVENPYFRYGFTWPNKVPSIREIPGYVERYIDSRYEEQSLGSPE